jgi:hypothetical protein
MRTPYRLKAQSPRSIMQPTVASRQPMVLAMALRQRHHRGRGRRHVGHGRERDLLAHRRLEQELVQDVGLVAHANLVLEHQMLVAPEDEVVSHQVSESVERHGPVHRVRELAHVVVILQQGGEGVEIVARDQLEIHGRLAHLILAEHARDRALGRHRDGHVAQQRRRRLVFVGIDDEHHGIILEELVGAVDQDARLGLGVRKVLDGPLDGDVEVAEADDRHVHAAELRHPGRALHLLLHGLEPDGQGGAHGGLADDLVGDVRVGDAHFQRQSWLEIAGRIGAGNEPENAERR